MTTVTLADTDVAQCVVFAVEESPQQAAMHVAVYREDREKAERERVLGKAVRLLEARRGYVLADMARNNTKDDSHEGGQADALFKSICALGAIAMEGDKP
jgi:hypothetical protein